MAVSQAIRVSDVGVFRREGGSAFSSQVPVHREAYVSQIARIAVGRDATDSLNTVLESLTESHDDDK